MTAEALRPLADSHLVRRGAGLPLIMIHGNGVDHRLLTALDPALDTAGGVERIYLDLPGFGKSPALDGDGGLPDLAAWLVARVAELVGDQPFALLGNSLGGLLARHVRAAFPDQVAGLALLAPCVDPDPTHRTLPRFEVVERDEDLLASLTDDDRDAFTDMTARQTRESWALFSLVALPGIHAADEAAMERLSRRYYLEREPEADGWQFGGPCLVVTGRQDHVVGWEDQDALVRDHYPSATVAVLDGAGHNVHVDRPGPVAALVRAWAEDVVRRTGADDTAPHRLPQVPRPGSGGPV